MWNAVTMETDNTATLLNFCWCFITYQLADKFS